MLGNIGMPELLVIFLFILIFFGSKKIPEIAKGLGQGMREFRKAMKDIEDTVQRPGVSDMFADKNSDHAPAATLPASKEAEVKK